MSAVEAVEPTRTLPAGSSPELVLQGLYERHSERIFGFCLRRLRTRPEAEDAVQNTFLCAFRALQRGVVPLCEHAWLFKIAENVCLSAHRSNGRRREHELAHDPDAVDELTAGEADGETARELERALASLPETQRRALLMREWRGLSYREIATQLGTSVAAVETLIFRARRGVVRALNGESGVKSRLAGALNLGSLFGSLKAALGGATAAKLVAAAAVVAVAALPAGDTASATGQAGAAPAAASTAEQSDAADPAHRTLARDGRMTATGDIAETGRENRPGGRSDGDRVTDPGSTKPTDPAQQDDQASDTAQPGGTPPTGTSAAGAPPPSVAVAPPLPGTPAVPLPETPAVPLPALPAVEAPVLPPPPELPQAPDLPKLPEAPKAPELPETPELPQLPVQPPDLEDALPSLPKLP